MYFTMQNVLDTAVLTWPDIFTTETFELLKSEKTEGSGGPEVATERQEKSNHNGDNG